jgi:hypothetical protein
MTESFDGATLARLRDELEVEIETRGTNGDHRTIIWVVVDSSSRVLIRSYRGANARWFREAVAAGEAGLALDASRVAVRVELAVDADRVAACSAELERTYGGDPAVPAMVADDVLDTTLEFHPG